MLTNGPGRVLPKTQKMVLDAALINIQHYKVRIKGKVAQSRKRSSALPYTSVSSQLKREHLVSLDYAHQLYLFIYIYNFL